MCITGRKQTKQINMSFWVMKEGLVYYNRILMTLFGEKSSLQVCKESFFLATFVSLMVG